MTKRLAIVAGMALLLGAVLFTALPTNNDGTPCGHWFNPEWDKARSQKLAQEYQDLADRASKLEDDDGLAAESEAEAYRVASSWRRCDGSLNNRRNLSIGLLIAAGVVPTAIMYVGGRKDQTATV